LGTAVRRLGSALELGWATVPLLAFAHVPVIVALIPVHAPASDVMIHVHPGSGLVRDGSTEHRVSPADIVVPAETDRGIKADDESRLQALVTAPPPTDEEHAPVRAGLANDEFDP
jgi:hypothetical protein